MTKIFLTWHGLTPFLGFLVLLGSAAEAEEWPHWRGPQLNGISVERDLATEWSPDRNILWRQPLPGSAGATPIIVGGRVFLTSASEEELVLCAYQAVNGEPLWQRTVTTGDETVREDEGNYASPSPVTDGEHVVAVMGDGNMACYSVTGEPLWRLDLNERLGPLSIQFGYTSTPVLHEGRLYVQWIHGDGDAATHEARVACFDIKTGETLWSSPRVTEAHEECEHSYASPILAGEGGEKVLVTHGADVAVAYNLDSGEEVWRIGGLNLEANYHPQFRFVASPVANEGLVVVPTAKKGAVVAVSIGGQGDLTDQPHQRWRLDKGTPDVPSPIIHEGLVYLCGETGNLTCYEAETGEQIYRKRTIADRHRASPVLADGKIYLASRRGVVTVVKAGREFEVLAKNDLEEPISSSLAISDGVIFLRTFEALYAIATEKKIASLGKKETVSLTHTDP